MTSTGERDLPREQWSQFFVEISRAYRDTPVTLELRPADAGAERVAVGEPFSGIDASSADGSLRIQAGGRDQMISAPTAVRLRPVAGGAGQVVEISSADGSAAWLHLGRDTQHEAMRGAMAGGAVAPAMTTLGAGDDSPVEALEARARGQFGPDDRAAAAGAADSGASELDHDRSPATADRDDPAPLGDSAGAAGGSVAAPAGSRSGGAFGDPAADLVTFGSSDGMGGAGNPTDRAAAQVDPGGSVGDVDLSGRTSYDIARDVYSDDIPEIGDVAGDPGASGGMGASAPAEIVDLGGDQGVIDATVDPISGDQLVAGNDADDGYLTGEVGAQAERDLDDMIGRRTQRKLPPAPKE